MISAIARASAAPLKRSRAMARDSTEVEQAPAAWMLAADQQARQVVWRSAHQMLPAKNTANPISTGQRRP